MGPTLSPETSAFKVQTPGKFPEECKLHSEHGECLKTRVQNVWMVQWSQWLMGCACSRTVSWRLWLPVQEGCLKQCHSANWPT